jgi:hypothetical protein
VFRICETSGVIIRDERELAAAAFAAMNDSPVYMHPTEIPDDIIRAAATVASHEPIAHTFYGIAHDYEQHYIIVGSGAEARAVAIRRSGYRADDPAIADLAQRILEWERVR